MKICKFASPGGSEYVGLASGVTRQDRVPRILDSLFNTDFFLNLCITLQLWFRNVFSLIYLIFLFDPGFPVLSKCSLFLRSLGPTNFVTAPFKREKLSCCRIAAIFSSPYDSTKFTSCFFSYEFNNAVRQTTRR